MATTQTTFYVERRSVRYHEDAAALFAALGGTTASDSVLLESADVESKKNTMCIATLTGAVRVTCVGQTVTATPLTPTGRSIIDRLCSQLAEYLAERHTTGEATFAFTRAQELNERERLTAVSNAEVLRALQRAAGYSGKELPLLSGGFAFDYLETFEVLPEVGSGENTYPDYQFLVAETLLVIDHLNREAFIEAVGINAEELTSRLDLLVEKISSDIPELGIAATPSDTPSEVLHVQTSMNDPQFCTHVEELKKSIHSGDVYQVVPARSFSTACDNAYAAYLQLRASNPSPYMFYVRGQIASNNIAHNNNEASCETYEIIGASPESNLKFDAATRNVQLYPIAGTRPRGLNPDGSVNHELDVRAELDMRTNAKEIAEHTMLVDLARNDLARVAVPATRKVSDLLSVDRYSRVMHLVSRVSATLHSDFDAIDAYRACMNMGTLSGAPKLRAMELLRGTEGTRRGSYGGAIGYLRGDGTMDTCIVIRSAFIHNGTAIVQAGAGVVRDSIPQAEADETLHKAYAVLNALAMAQNATPKVNRS
ncbi:anthranilate synthase component 1 [Corynebacterium ulcerans]|uniref:anthranilate synthase n=1 Tax=Corynebacterium ulcerans TaxID=65058 RepID=A0ABD0BH92_CORUL|nr:anthranilate synthase component 1 [Corynebacterium ulcerans]AEG85029.1 anthranilate synthase component I [Corynebacterium ulcerans BR-AD22]KPH73993.1 anthranilate synthase [Corynebacterium ulcerans]MBH5297695.1 anthranilate synthase component 1 [Corynebacterium ulcerans]MBH5302848.1 anthranilate synthase component 1 [Corynebacterium ulcerans]MBL4944566.1 anthranilate synthase component 1 [Corynebacterium ulcerans]